MENRKMMKDFGWGDPQIRFDIQKPEFRKYLADKFAISPIVPEREDWSFEGLSVKQDSLTREILSLLEDTLSTNGFSTDPKDRIRHAFGKSYKDLIRLRLKIMSDIPDVVLYPNKQKHLYSLMEMAKKYNIALIPFGGGTSVVGGVEALRKNKKYLASIDLTNLNKILELDEKSALVSVEAGIYGPQLESFLNDHGYTLGHFPQSFEYSTVGGWLAARSSGQNSVLYGNISHQVVGLKMVTPSGIIESPTTPSMARGPDIMSFLVGSEGTLGIITSCTLKIKPLPEEKMYLTYLFRSFDEAAQTARSIIQSGIVTAMIRVSDEDETDSMLALLESAGTKRKKLMSGIGGFILRAKGFALPRLSLMMIGFEGTKESNCFQLQQLKKVLRTVASFSLGTQPGQKWLKQRFHTPYLRDPLLDNHLLVDTLETATTWKNLHPLYSEVRKSLLDFFDHHKIKAEVYAHISHVYHEGASLYFSVIAQREESDPLAQWTAMKQEAGRAIIRRGGVISHHHGIGLDHRGFLNLSVAESLLLRSAKNALDPEGIMNPGKLID